jgi:hypothetical protein
VLLQLMKIYLIFDSINLKSFWLKSKRILIECFTESIHRTLNM